MPFLAAGRMTDGQAASAGLGPSASACCWLISAPPTAPIRRGVRVYLKEFLSDPRVIENQGLLWKLALNGIILRTRPRRKARDYLKIWNTEKNESPLKTITRAQAEKLAAAIALMPCRGRLGDALWQSLDRSRIDALERAGLRPAAGGAALSAIFGGDVGDGVRRGVSRARQDARAADACGSRRLITTTPSISTRWRSRSRRI